MQRLRNPGLSLLFALFLALPALAQREGLIIGQSCNIYFQRWGTGRPILIVGDPALPFAGSEAVAQKLSKRNQVIVYDPRGTGRTKLPRMDTSTVNHARAAEDIESIRQVLRLPKLTLLAAPGGHEVTKKYAQHFPSNVDGLIWLTGENWVTSGVSHAPKLDSLLAFSARETGASLPEKPSLRVAWTDTEAFYGTIDHFIRQHRLDYVKPEPPKKTGRAHGRGNQRRKRA
jgi:pimeloyl-ACP methyl ester carboxylesterase